MKKQVFCVSICLVLIIFAVTLTACSGERDALQAMVETLENENEEFQSTISSLRNDLERAQNELTRTQNELQNLIAELEADDEDDEQTQGAVQSGPLAITTYGRPSTDMSWPLRDGNLPLGLSINYDEVDEDIGIIWYSTNENVFTVTPSDDSLSVIVTPVAKGSAQIVVMVGDLETRSWVRIT